MSDPTEPENAPGDEAPSERKETAPNFCPDCDGSGQVEGGACQTCAGTGRVEEAVGGG
jgi:DnaJ-class molecular chaperone